MSGFGGLLFSWSARCFSTTSDSSSESCDCCTLTRETIVSLDDHGDEARSRRAERASRIEEAIGWPTYKRIHFGHMGETGCGIWGKGGGVGELKKKGKKQAVRRWG